MLLWPMVLHALWQDPCEILNCYAEIIRLTAQLLKFSTTFCTWLYVSLLPLQSSVRQHEQAKICPLLLVRNVPMGLQLGCYSKASIW